MRRELLLLTPILLLCSLTAAVGSEEPRKVAVALSEYTLAMPETLPPGPTVFQVRNEGRKNHSFKIEGPGIDRMLEAVVRPNETGNLQVTLQAGEYKVYCPIGSHAAKGMTRTLVVGEKPRG